LSKLRNNWSKSLILVLMRYLQKKVYS